MGEPQHDTAVEPAPRRARLLLVDDNAETLVLLRALLEDEGFEIAGTATGGVDALAFVEERDPDVVLMDLRMPGMNGFEATRLIKERRPSVQVILMTFYKELLDEFDPAEVGAFAYLVKGCSAQLMRDVILQAWRHRLEERWSLGARP